MRPYFEKHPSLIYISHLKKTYNFKSHFHNNLEIVFCFSGAESIKIDDTFYTLKKGDAAIIFPNTVHEYLECAEGKNTETEILAVIFDNKLISGIIPDISSKYTENPIVKSDFVSEDARLAFSKIPNAENDASLLGWTYIVLSELLKVVPVSHLNRDFDLPPKIIEYINKSFKEPLTITHIAGVFGYSPSYIAHIFCDQLKIPFRTYLGAVRSEYAANLIRTSQMTLTEIAYDSGYQSLNTFCRCFKKHFGLTPSQYKKQNTN